ncbi:hypothetical protein KAU33_04315 [Candidatus Dependentiae bacterium]|nr:hypothetical protein [Candidatus Dependentiae bacterium]
MDLTPKNIVLCRQAKELQDLFRNSIKYAGTYTGHYIVWQYKDDLDHYEHISILGEGIEYDRVHKCLFAPGIGHGSHMPENYQILDYDWAWIPRLDQLFGLMSGGFMAKIAKLFNFGSGIDTYFDVCLKNYRGLPTNDFHSTEQVAIGLVMLENYEKVWNGVKWVESHR